MRILWRAVAVLLFMQLRPVLAEPTPAQTLLAQMSAALRQTDFQGSFIYQHAGQLDALRIFHAGGDRERERLVSMSGLRSEIVRDGATVTCMRTGGPTVLLPNRFGAHLLPLIPETRGLWFPKFYAAHAAGDDRVAGYPVRIVEIEPKDHYRYGYRIWLDDATHLPLRSMVVDGAGHGLEQFMFVAIDIGAKPKQSDLAPSDNSGVVAPPAETVLGKPQWRVADLPPGFRFLHAQKPTQGPQEAEHHVYTDGIAEVSVYMEPRDSQQPAGADRATARGVLSIYTHDVGSWRATVLGDVPRVTVERIARSVQPVTPATAAPLKPD